MPRRPIALTRFRPMLPGLFLALLLASLLAGCSVSIGTRPAPPPPAAAPVPAPRTERVTIQGLNLRQGPSSKAPAIGSLDHNEVVTILERQGNWIRVRTAAGQEGFAYGAYLTGFDIRPSRTRSGGDAPARDPSRGGDGLSPEEEQDLWN